MTHKNDIAYLAARQHGNITRAQLPALGLGPSAITWRLQTGELHRVHTGVYAVGHPPTAALQRVAAAVLACGLKAALSHHSALTLWRLTAPGWSFPLHVTAPTRRRRPGIVAHYAALPPQDIGIQLGIRATSPSRTLLDCAPTLPERRLLRIAADARRAGLLHERALLELLDRHPHHPGARRLRALLDGQALRSRSEFELEFLAFCERYALPKPLLNTIVHGYEVDAFFPSHNVIVELDGWEFHRDRQNFESDRRKDADLLVVGYPTIRLTWERFTSTPDEEASRLRRILGLS